MAERETRRMTLEEFLAWDPGDDERYELVDGVPVAMTGARRRHDDILMNAAAILKPLLRGRTCKPNSDDLGVRTGITSLRRPDLVIDCGPKGPDDLVASSPRVLIEILSPSTRRLDKAFKTIEYKRIESVMQVLIVDPDDVSALLHDRQRSGWIEQDLVGPETTVDLWSVGVQFPLGALYDDIA